MNEHEELRKRIGELESNISALQNTVTGDLHMQAEDDARITELEAELTPSKEFARKVIGEHCWGYNLDGLEIQELAEKLGLLTLHAATESDVDEESDFEVGDTIYRFTEILKESK